MANFFDQFDSAPASPSAAPASRYAGAISSIESGGNYREVGPDTGSMGRALGKYQVMSANVRPWSKEILGREVTPQEFISDPKIQDAIFEGKFGQYVEKYGPDGAARAWFAGEKGMKNPNARDVLGTTVAEYSRRFNKALGPDARGAVEQFGPGQPEAMAFAETPKMSQAKPEAKNFFDQFDEVPATQTRPDNGRIYISPAPDAPSRVPAGEARPDRGVVDATARGVAQGFTANFGDEIRGLIEASGANPDDPASLSRLVTGALKYWSGDAEAKKRYDEAVQRERELNKTAEEQHPIASTVGNVGGAVILPVGAGAGAATLGGRMAIGAGTGAALGGAAGAGEGQGFVDSASRAASGAAIGGALGGVAPAAIEGVVRGARAIAQPVANAVRGVRDVEGEASRRVVTALERDRQIDPQAAQRLTPSEFAASVQGGGPAVIADLGGETTRGLARSAANTSPEGRAVLNKAINDRFEGQSPRVMDWLRKTFNSPDAGATGEAIDQAAKAYNRPAYAKAYAKGQSLWDDGLEQLSQAPIMQQAIRMAFVTGRNRAALDGFPPIKNPFAMNRETGMLELQPGTTPNLQFWDHVKRNLDKMGAEGQAFSRALRGHLDQLVPEYQTARAGAAAFFGAENAVEAGEKFVTMKANNMRAARELAKMPPHERELFKEGFVSKYLETLNEVGDRRDILNKIADSPAARERLNMVLGKGKADELEAVLRVEGIMDLARNAVQGNSTTARQLAELGLAGGAYGFSGGGINPFTDPGAVVNAALVYGAARGRNAINERLSRRVAEMLVSNDPRTITRGINTVVRNQSLFNALRRADQGIARIGGEQAGGVPALQAAGVGRAEDQPNVPRPPGQ